MGFARTFDGAFSPVSDHVYIAGGVGVGLAELGELDGAALLPPHADNATQRLMPTRMRGLRDFMAPPGKIF